MNFKCFVCENLFSEQKIIVKHLKKDHFVKENKDPIYCLKNNNCKRYFLNFRALNDHLKTCSVDVEQEVKLNYLENQLEFIVYFSLYFNIQTAYFNIQ